MSLVSNLIRWTPKIAEASADDIAQFGPQAARVRALLNFIPGMSDDAAKITSATDLSQSRPISIAASNAVSNAASNAGRDSERIMARVMAGDRSGRPSARAASNAVSNAASTEVVSDLITPEVYRTLTNPLASARALDRLAGRAPESFVPTARDLSERGLITNPSDIVTSLRISKLPQQQQSLVMGLVDSGLTLEEAMQAARALS
jgi:hypothetical protein